jgi:hypothetical protein
LVPGGNPSIRYWLAYITFMCWQPAQVHDVSCATDVVIEVP